MLAEIGRGGQAYVKEAIDLQSHQHVAIKIYKKSKMTLDDLNAAHAENQITKNLESSSLLRRIGFFEDTQYLCIIFELMQLNLRRLLSRENLTKDVLEEANICRMFHQMVHAVSACHAKAVIHCDVKLENFLVR